MVIFAISGGRNWIVSGPRNDWAALGLSGAELGLPGAPWPSAHCPACQSSSSVSATREGANRPRLCLWDKWLQRFRGVLRQLSPLPWEQVGLRRCRQPCPALTLPLSRAQSQRHTSILCPALILEGHRPTPTPCLHPCLLTGAPRWALALDPLPDHHALGWKDEGSTWHVVGSPQLLAAPLGAVSCCAPWQY